MLDAHQHFWRYNPVKDPWITDEMAVLRRDFMPNDLHPLLVANGFSGCIAVQADQSESETQFLIDLAGQYDFIRGVVGWVDLCAENVSDRLAFWQKHTQLKGFRHILQGEQPDFMLQPDFNRGIQR